MVRRLFTLLSMLSLLMFVAAAVLWVRSHQRVDAMDVDLGVGRWRVTSHAGRISADNSPARELRRKHQHAQIQELEAKIERQRDRSHQALANHPIFSPHASPEQVRRYELDIATYNAQLAQIDAEAATTFGQLMSILGYDAGPPPEHCSLHVGALVAGTFVLPLIWIAIRMLNRPRRGFCVSCGYDMRASPTRCPECGAVPKAA